jgi:hypothetical protein
MGDQNGGKGKHFTDTIHIKQSIVLKFTLLMSRTILMHPENSTLLTKINIKPVARESQ